MKSSKTLMNAEAQTFNDLVDRWVYGAVTRGVTSFNSLIASLPGVYPSVVYESLKRLTAADKFGNQNLPLISGVGGIPPTTLGRPANHSHSITLPVPHPLDFDWRFSDSAVKYLLDKCLTLTKNEETIVLLGTPSVFRYTLESPYPRSTILLDSNQIVISQIKKQVPSALAMQCDIMRDRVPQITATAVVVDPPWYEEQMMAFMLAATKICQVGGYVLASIPPIGTRPGISRDRDDFFKRSCQLGLELVEIEAAILPYLSPLFEINALRAEGLCDILSEWRRGDLAIFIKSYSDTQQVVVSSRKNHYWTEQTLYGVRVRLRQCYELDFADPSLVSIVDGDILPSASRRDTRRQLVDVWTSGNRVFACRGRKLLAQIMHALATAQAPIDLVTGIVGRKLTTYEKTLVTRAADQISEIVKIERDEIYLFERSLLNG